MITKYQSSEEQDQGVLKLADIEQGFCLDNDAFCILRIKSQDLIGRLVQKLVKWGNNKG